MNRDYAETYEEYKSGKYEYVKGYGRFGCYQGLDYIENILKDDKYYSEELEDGFIFIQSYINCVEQQCKKQQEVIDRVRNNLEKDISMIKKITMCKEEIITRLEATDKMLKEVSE